MNLMKQLSLIFIVLFLTACKKEETYGPYKLKNGQEVELLIDHRYEADNAPILILPQSEAAGLSIHGFPERKPGYIYRVKAKFNKDPNPPQDASDSWFNLTKVISEEKYKGNESFEISLIKSYIPGGPFISLHKIGDKYQYIQDKLELTYANQTVKDQLEEIWQNAQGKQSKSTDNSLNRPKWKSIKATVTHDPNNFGKAYLVQRIEFTL